MKRKNLFIFISLICFIMVGCSTTLPNDFFVKETAMEPGYEYLADVFVLKEGFYFLWCIPFSSNAKDKALDIMVRKARAEFPTAEGLFDVKVEMQENVGVLLWTPDIVMKGKIVRKVKAQ